MNINKFDDPESMNLYGSELIIDFLKKKPKSLISVATGNSTIGLYKELHNYFKYYNTFFSKVIILKLDEWLTDLRYEHEGFCEQYIQSNIIEPLNISSSRFISFKTNTKNPIEECERVNEEINKRGPIDLCILGLGKNGHIGFIEPGAPLYIRPYVAELSILSQNHEMISGKTKRYKKGLTLSLNQILSSKKIIIVISGQGKDKAKEDFLSAKISRNCPASFLWMHKNIECLILN